MISELYLKKSGKNLNDSDLFWVKQNFATEYIIHFHKVLRIPYLVA